MKILIKIPSKKTYPELGRGEKGDSVKQLQNRLIELGYLAPGEADGVYGAKTARAVHKFKGENYMVDTCAYAEYCTASSDMQKLLYSSDAYEHLEDYVTLEILHGAYMEWTELSGNKLKIRVEVTNNSITRSVKAFELRAYPEDIWGNALLGEGYSYYWTTQATVKPGETIKSGYCTMDYRDQIDKIYVAVSKVIYSDGTQAEVDYLDYFEWDYK